VVLRPPDHDLLEGFPEMDGEYYSGCETQMRTELQPDGHSHLAGLIEQRLYPKAHPKRSVNKWFAQKLQKPYHERHACIASGFGTLQVHTTVLECGEKSATIKGSPRTGAGLDIALVDNCKAFSTVNVNGNGDTVTTAWKNGSEATTKFLDRGHSTGFALWWLAI
jgi:hypothetical protein